MIMLKKNKVRNRCLHEIRIRLVFFVAEKRVWSNFEIVAYIYQHVHEMNEGNEVTRCIKVKNEDIVIHTCD